MATACVSNRRHHSGSRPRAHHPVRPGGVSYRATSSVSLPPPSITSASTRQREHSASRSRPPDDFYDTIRSGLAAMTSSITTVDCPSPGADWRPGSRRDPPSSGLSGTHSAPSSGTAHRPTYVPSGLLDSRPVQCPRSLWPSARAHSHPVRQPHPAVNHRLHHVGEHRPRSRITEAMISLSFVDATTASTTPAQPCWTPQASRW